MSNDGIELSLDFGPVSFLLTKKDLVQEVTLSPQGKGLPTQKLSLSRRQDFLNNHFAQFPIKPNMEGTMEMRDEIFSSVGEQYGDSIG